MYTINPNILQTPISDGKILLLEPRQGLYFELNEVSVFIYQSINDGISEAHILENIIKEFNVSNEVAKADMFELTQQLLKNNIISTEP